MRKFAAALLFPAALVLCACSKPPILHDIQCSGSGDCEAASHAFDQAVRTRFPLGTDQRHLEEALLSEGFVRANEPQFKHCAKDVAATPVGEVSVPCPEWDAHWNPQQALVYRHSDGFGSPCSQVAGVLWSINDEQKISHIEGYFEHRCI